MKNLKNLGEALNKSEQQAINGGDTPNSRLGCRPCCPEGCRCYRGFCITNDPSGPGLCFNG